MKRPLVLLGSILALTTLVFSRSLANGFVLNWDDNLYIVYNITIRQLSLQGVWSFFSTFQHDNYHPLTTLSFAVEYALFGLSPRPYHAVNLLLHLLNVVLVFRLFDRLTQRREIATITAVLFAVHPMHVESVAWISGRKDLLFTLFSLGALLSYVAFVRREAAKSLLLLSWLLFLLALLSKSAAVSLPAVLLLVDYFERRKFTRETALEKVPFVILSVLFGVVALISQERALAVAPALAFHNRIVVANYAIAQYLVKLVLPLHLSAFHPYPEVRQGWLPPAYYLSFAITGPLAYVLYRAKSIRRDALFAGLFFLSTIALMLQVLPVGRAVVAERYTYLPYLGWFFLIGRWYCRVSDRSPGTPTRTTVLFTVVLAGAIAVFSLVSWDRTRVWENGTTLFSDVIAKYPTSDVAYTNRAIMRVSDGWYRAAIADCDTAVRLNPDTEAYFTRGLAREKLGDRRGAIDDYTQAIDRRQHVAEAYRRRAFVKYTLTDSAGAIADYTQALQVNPRFADAHYELGALEFELRRPEQACAAWRRAAALGNAQAAGMVSRVCR